MSDKNMTLFMRIRANGEEGRKMFKQLNHDLVQFQKNQKELWTGIGGAAASPFKAIGAVGGVMFAPLKIAAEAAGALTGGLIALGSAALYSAAEGEKLQSRLTKVAGSALQGVRAMEVLEGMSRHSQFKTDDLAEAAIIMKNYGIDSQRSLRAVASAAKTAGVGIEVLALQTMSLSSIGHSGALKRMGIVLDDANGNPVIKFRDRMGQIRKIVTKDADEARRKLIDVFALKFGTDISPKTFSGFVDMLKNNIGQAFANFGDGLLRPAKRFIDYISGGLSTAIENGNIKEWGEKAGAWLDGAVNKFIAFIRTMQVAFQYIPKLLEDGARGFQNVLMAAISGVANTFGVALVEYLVAAKDIFISLGKIIGGALMEELLKLDLPFMKSAREKGVKSALAGMTEDQARAAGINPEFAGNADRMMSPEKWDELDARIEDFIKGMNPDQAAHLAAQGFHAGDLLMDGARQFRDSLVTLKDRISATAGESFKSVNTAFKQSAGPDLRGAFDGFLGEENANSERFGKEQATARFTSLVPDNGNPLIRRTQHRDETRMVDAGMYREGQRTSGGGVIIKIEKLNVHASSAEQVTREVIGAGKRGTAMRYAH